VPPAWGDRPALGMMNVQCPRLCCWPRFPMDLAAAAGHMQPSSPTTGVLLPIVGADPATFPFAIAVQKLGTALAAGDPGPAQGESPAAHSIANTILLDAPGSAVPHASGQQAAPCAGCYMAVRVARRCFSPTPAQWLVTVCPPCSHSLAFPVVRDPHLAAPGVRKLLEGRWTKSNCTGSTHGTLRELSLLWM
jgi:hypothetical protein